MSDKKENEQKSLLGDFFKSIGAGIAKDPLLSALLGILTIAGSVLANPAISGARLTAFVVITLILVVGLLVFLFKRGTGVQREQIRKMSQATVNMNPNTVELAGQLAEEARQGIRRILQGAAEETADLLGVPKGLVRANLFGVDGDRNMRILRGLTHNMNRDEELTISMPVGYGSTGICFDTGKPNIAVFRENWGSAVIAGSELSKVHPDLRWIVSVPVLITTGAGAKPFWVLNVDGLNERKTETQLQPVVPNLFKWSQLISLILASTVKKGES